MMIAGAMALVCACSKSEPATQGLEENEIDFRIGMADPATKVTDLGFQVGDRIGVWAVERNGGAQMPLQIGGNFINNEQLTLQDGSNHWRGARTLYYSSQNCDFYGLFPYQASITSIEEQPFSVQTDQSSAANYIASDLLWAYAGNVAPQGTVNMAFKHILSKLSVVIVKGPKFEGDIPVDITVHIYNTTTEGKVNLRQGTIEKDNFGAKRTLTAKKISSYRFETIVVPQFIEKKTPLIEVTMGGIAYLLEYSISLRPGYEHTIELTLNTSPDQEMIEIGIDAESQAWS